ncbi:hypothetical protein K466DRAFT_668589 [Polyporus arcularius HHB13444]|uniref:Uncharacterized protein n=1 Tax=Polyporus arcularius HHB13444 TaxID=1314778 RepID=A0A5C3NMJ9_9APHY|nr:hypothetical protein K466DRAFT_668589 [Polyporus arcularius HHB13444]
MSTLSKRSAGSHALPPSKRRDLRQTPQLPTADDLNVPLTEPSDLLATFTAQTEHKLLTNLLNDPALRPGVIAHIHALLADGYPAYVSSIRTRADRATEPLREPSDYRQKKMISIGDHAEACMPFLHDVVRVARLPFPGAAKQAFELLREIHDHSMPDYENVGDDEEKRTQFDEAVDDLLAGLLRRLRELGDKEALDENWLKELHDELQGAAEHCQENFDMEDLFAKTISLLEDCLAIEIGSSDEEGQPEEGDSQVQTEQ